MKATLKIRTRISRAFALVVVLSILVFTGVAPLPATPIASLNYKISGTALQVSPPVLSVPKGIPGSVFVTLTSGGSTNNAAVAQLAAGAYVQAIIRGPSFPSPQRLVSAPNAPLLLPPINLVGNYELDSIALVDATTGKVRLEGSPSSVPVNVFDQLLVSSVTSTPLSLDQIQQAGIQIDNSNFRAVQFNVSFVLNGQTIPISFPVVSPTFTASTELVPADEIEAKLTQAALINQQIASTMVTLPPQLQTAQLNLQIQGINFQVTDPGPGQSLALAIPPIPALMVIPGNIGYLHQFFSVQLFTENGAPQGSGLTVNNLEATLQLPPGPDGIVSTNYNDPGDDPLRFARIGPNNIIQPTQPVVDPGPDGQLGTADDVANLQPGETGQAEFLVEGLQEGLAVMNIDITGTLQGLPAGPVQIEGKAAGSVLVRNPTFSLTFAHPDVVRVGEPYTASVTVLNTGTTPANLVQVTLNSNSISGATFAPGQQQTIELNTISPGQSATATYNMVSQRTGQIEFSDITTGDDSVTGRFLFTMGVDAQGVPLSPDTIAMPDFVNNLPSNLVFAATRVLGQALSIATAAQLPPGVAPVDNAIITRRVLDLAEAGQRVQYGDPLNRVLPDLLRDWQGGRVPDDGFDSLLRTSDAGAEWRATIFSDMEADNLTGTQRLLTRAADLAGLGQQFVVASAGPGQLRADFTGTTNSATTNISSEPYADDYAGANGEWAVTPDITNAVYTWTFTNGPPIADMAVLIFGTNGQAQQLRWQVANPPVTAIYRFALSDSTQKLQVDTNGDGTVDLTLSPSQATINELPPGLVAVQQDLTVVAGRPSPSCVGPDYGNYGTVVAVVYSKPMTQDSAGDTNSYAVDGDNTADSVQIQPSGRVALLNLHKGISAIIPRKMTITGVTDVHGNPLIAAPAPIQCFFPGTTNLFTGGAALTGRVLLGDGTPAPGVPVTLTMYDGAAEPDGCQTWVQRVSQVLTDSGGNFNFDFVMSGIPYSVSASDTIGLNPTAIQAVMESTLTTQPDSQILQQILSSSTNVNALLAALSASNPGQAVILVEGLDRAVVNDTIGLGSGREGQTVPFILRFRGRATVSGEVVASDGVTPVPNAAVNLFPDPSSLELGRGVFADGTGSFTFPGIPLGVFSIQVATSDNRAATVLGIIETPGGSTNMVIPLPDTQMFYGEIRGEVFDSDNVTPIPNARVYLGHYDSSGNAVRGIVATVNADPSGAFDVTNVPIENLDVVAVTFDGTRVGARTGIVPSAKGPIYVNVALQAATTVFGRVEFDDGAPATNALVAGGLALVRTDQNGNFQLQGVPVGVVTVSAGLEPNPAAGIDFTRLGSTSTTIIAGSANYVVVKLRPAGRIFGRVFDANGNIQPNIRVAIPQQGGFYWTIADTNGNYVFDNLPLGEYIISAPANAVAPSLDTSSLDQQLSSGDESQILAAFQEAVTVFVGAEDPLINGDDLNFNPSSWGYTSANLNFDGADVNADVHFITQGTVTGTVLNPQGIPIGSEVRLTGLGPDPTGLPVMTIRGDSNSDPASGKFGFTNVLLAGAWGLQTASPFYPVIVQTNGFTTEIDPNVSGVILKFPPINDVNGPIVGHVFNPDGTLVGQGTQVHISVSADYQIETDTNGFFNTQTEFPAIGVVYNVTVFDPNNGLQGQANIAMTPGITNVVDVHLLSRNSTIQVQVLQASGVPAPGATLELDQGTFPNDPPLFATCDTNGLAVFSGLWEGSYSLMGQFTEASTKLSARAGATVGPNQTVAVTLHMGATGTVKGKFLKQDLVTPVFGANVAIGNLGFASTDTNGNFEFDGVPVGTYQIASSDPVTGGNATGSVTISFNGQTQSVTIVEATLGTVSGLVLDPFSSSFVPNASVIIGFNDGVTPSRTVTTGPNGAFNFPGSPMGGFNLSAQYRLPGTLGTTVFGQANGTLSPSATNVSVNIQLQPLTSFAVHVVKSDGVTPAQNAQVTINGTQDQDTSTNGDVVFNNLSVPSSYTIIALSDVGGDLSDGASTNVTITGRATNDGVTLVLPGVANVAGSVVGSDGVTPIVNAQITLTSQNPLFSSGSDTALTDSSGKFLFNDVPLGPFLVTAASQSLAASENGTNDTPNETNIIALRLGASGTIIGTVVRADGVTPVGDVDVEIDFMSQSSNPGRVSFHTGSDGAFQFNNVPVGKIHVSSAAPSFGGIINFTTTLATNGEILDLGSIRYDEDVPTVVQILPPAGTIGVPITNNVEILFNEALDSNSLDPSGILIRSTNDVDVPCTITLLADSNGVQRILVLQPKAPLQSLTTYQVIVLSGNLPGPTGQILGIGPTDLVGRPLAASFESEFTTADQTPPNLLSIFPSNNAVQIDPSSVPRLTFDKAMNPSGFFFTLNGPQGSVSGTASLGINGQVLTFLPDQNLQANASYTLVASNLFDLSGNSAVGQPYISTFATIDTIGPVISNMDIVSNAQPIAGSTILVEAILATNEAGASVRFTQDFNPIGSVSNLPYRIPVTLPTSGSTTILAIATDRFGNDGQFAQLVITIQPPTPPTVHFTLLSPTNTPIPNGTTVIVDVSATGDTAISNLTALIGGAVTGGALLATNGSDLHVQGFVPNTATPNQSIQVFAQATDAVGASSGQQVFNLPIEDTVAPTLVIVGPTNNAHLPAAASFGITNIFSDNSSNLSLAVSVTGSFTFAETNPVVVTPNVVLTNILTIPLTNAPTNGGPITATLTVTDAASNSTTLARTYWLANTPGPAIASLTIASNFPPLAGFTVPIVAVLASNVPGASVSFTQDSVPVATVTSAPYQISVVLPASGSTTIRAIASDAFGNVGVAAQLVITVQQNVQPTIRFVQIVPPSGPVPSGSNFVVNVVPSGNGGAFNLSATVSGPVSGTFATTGTNLQVQGSVPATTVAGQQIKITAQATDEIGQSTGPQSFTIPVSDGTAPTLAITDPPPNAQLTPSATLPITLVLSDNSAAVTLGVSVTGGLTNNQTIPVALTPNTPATNVVTIPVPNEPTNGSAIIATITATDMASNTTTVQRLFWLPGSQTTVTWDRQALGQTFPCTNGPGSYTWPNNNNWSQSETFGTACTPGVVVETQPSNWSTTDDPDATNLDVILGGLGGAPANLDISVSIHSLTIQSNGGLNMANGKSLTAVNLDVPDSGTITRSGSGNTIFLNGGTMDKADGTNVFTIDPGIALISSNATFAVDSGTLALPASGSIHSNATFQVASNGIVVLTPTGQSVTMAGTISGVGGGVVALASGTLNAGAGGVTFNLPDPMMQLTAITMSANNPFTNTGAMTLSGSTRTLMQRNSQFGNNGFVRQTGSGGFDLQLDSRFDNLVSGTYDFEADAGIFTDDSEPQNFDNFGLLRKSVGTNVSSVSLVNFNNQGGTIEVDTGTISLANNGNSSNGTFNVAVGAVLDLTGGQQPTWAGQMTGSGAGQVVFANGTIHANPSLTMNLPDGLFQWTGGTLTGIASNINTASISGANKSIIERSSQFNNSGLFRHRGSAGLDLHLNAAFENLGGGTYDIETNSGIFTDDSQPQNFDNFGLFRKSGGTGVANVSTVLFNDHGGTIEVDTGTLSLANNGSSSNGTFSVAAGAILDVTGGQQPTWAGQMNGSGAGQVVFSSGDIHANPSVMLNLPDGLFQWSGGTLTGVANNMSTISISGVNKSILERGGVFNNAGLVRHSGAGNLDLHLNAAFENLVSGTYDLEADTGLFTDDLAPQNFDNFGTFRKSGGTSNSVVSSVLFNNHGGLVDVESGNLVLANNGSSSNGTIRVAAGSTLDLTGGQGPTWAGLLNGSGAGQVIFASGALHASPGLTLNFVDGTFQWSGGTLTGVVTNTNFVTISGSTRSLLERASQFNNAGFVRHAGAGQLDLHLNADFENLASGTYDIETDTGIFTDDLTPQIFDNFGTLRKSGGTNTSTISTVLFNNLGGLVDVESGNLVLANNGSSTNSAIKVATNAVLDVTGGQSPTWSGQMNGTGQGQVVFASGTLRAVPSATLNFVDGLFHWNGGTLVGTVSNVNVVTISGASHSLLERSGQFYNFGLVRHAGPGSLDLHLNANFENMPSATFDLESDTGIFTDDSTPQNFDNFGTFRKSAGTNVSLVSTVSFNNHGGTIEVDSGVIALANNGSSSNGTVNVAAGAALDLTGGDSPTWAGTIQAGGAGAVELNSGTINASPSLTLNCSNSVFQWNGGSFTGVVTNANAMTISGANNVILQRSTHLYNAGVLHHTGTGSLFVRLNSSVENLASGTYDFGSDSSVTTDDSSPWNFNNSGTLKKSAGTNTSTIAITFSNLNGSIEVDSGTLSVGGNTYVQGTGAFTVQLGGTNSGQSGQFSAGNVTLGGPLHVFLTNGFLPAVGAHIPILSCSGLAGTFNTLDVPSGISVVYTGNGVVLVVTNTVSLNLRLSSQPMLSLQRAAPNSATIHWSDPGSNFVLEATSSVGPGAVWLPFTNMALTTTNGMLYFTIPTSNSTQFFRLRKR